MVVYYQFEGITQPEGLKVAFISRETIMLCSRKTNFKFIDVSNKFYDTLEEKNACLAMDEKQFEATIIKTFENQGYKFVRKHE